MIRGSCCCQSVRFELTEPPKMMGTCHCSRCRKSGASVFVIVDAATFRWVEGEEHVGRQPPREGTHYSRAFCGLCGTSLGDAGSGAATFAIAANSLDDDPGIRNRFHEFVADKPEWLPIGDEARQFPGHPTGG